LAWLEDGSKVGRAAILAEVVEARSRAIGASDDIEGAPTRQALKAVLIGALDDETGPRAAARRATTRSNADRLPAATRTAPAEPDSAQRVNRTPARLPFAGSQPKL